MRLMIDPAASAVRVACISAGPNARLTSRLALQSTTTVIILFEFLANRKVLSHAINNRACDRCD